jgi:dephospho-CoA kinase
LIRIVATAGLAGSGKGVFSEVAAEYGIPVFVCGDVVREETRKRGLPLTKANTGIVMLKIREEEGPAVISRRLIPKIDASGCTVAIVEGVRSLEEVDELRERYGNVTLIGIHSSPQTRFDRLRSRGREDDPATWEEFESRDLRELGVGLGKVMALADEMAVNEGTVEEFQCLAQALLQWVLAFE